MVNLQKDADFSKVTKQGYPILDAIHNKCGDLCVVFKRDHDYAWGWAYDPSTGTWGQGHYDFETEYDAIADICERYIV